jgi:Domain of Unknown Function (DUF1259)
MKPPVATIGLMVSSSLFTSALGAAEPDWNAVNTALGRTAKVQDDGTRRFGFPRTDLHVVKDGVSIEAPLALGSWAAFHGLPDGAVMAMGDLVLQAPEVNSVVSALQAGGFEVMAIHNHLIGETPTVTYVHFAAHGRADEVARSLRAALEKTATPLGPPAATPPPPAGESVLLQRVEQTLGHKGVMAGRVLQVSVARPETIQENGMEVPASMGMAIALNFQPVGERVATTGDFVLLASEVNPVVRELRSRGLEVTALHSHMLAETPRLFFLHFWGLDTPEAIGAALRAALVKTAAR